LDTEEGGGRMSANTYRVLMKTPLGEKEGILVMETDRGMLSGWLDIMKHREPFNGTVDEMGNCRICGVFVTLVRRVSYIAAGQVSPSSLYLKVEDGRNIFEMTGTACLESEE